MAENEGVKLLGMWASPFSRRIEMALKLKGVPYEYEEQDLFNKSPLLLELNPVHKKVPVLVHNGKAMAESLVILQYIDETWPNPPILPQEPYQRAMARFWARFVDEQILQVGWRSMVKAEKGIEAAVKDTQELLKFLEKELTGKAFFGGETVGFLDIAVATMIPFALQRYWDGLEIDVLIEEKFSEIRGWIKRLSEINSVKECIPPRDKQIKYMMGVADRIKSASEIKK